MMADRARVLADAGRRRVDACEAPQVNNQASADAERRAVEAYVDRRKSRSPVCGVKLTQIGDGGPVAIGFNHDDHDVGRCLVAHALGNVSPLVLQGLLGQLLNAGAVGQISDERQLNFMVSMIRDFEPRDPIETALMAQMAVVHCHVMNMARRLTNAETIPQQDAAERALNKLARTFAMLVEALKRHRSKGEQVVRVERVYVSGGGQAIVGNVTHPGGGTSNKSEDQSHEQRTISIHRGAALPGSFEAHAQTVPQSRDER